jgi:hypothetical protein
MVNPINSLVVSFVLMEIEGQGWWRSRFIE